MKSKALFLLLFAWFVVIALLVPCEVSADVAQVIKSFNVGEVSGIAVDADGIVWFTQRLGLKLGRLDPNTGDVRLYPIPYQTGARYGGGGNPEAILVSSSGDIWFSEIPMTYGGGPARIARFHPDTETFEEYLINPYWWNGYGGNVMLSPYGLTEGPDGKIWFNDRASYPHIGYVNPNNGIVAVFDALPYYLGSSGGGSYDIVVTQDGKVWYSNGFYMEHYRDSTYEKSLYFFDEDTNTFTNLGVTGASGLAADVFGNIWFTTWATSGLSGMIGQITPDSSVLFHTYASNTYTMSSIIKTDSKGLVWFNDWNFVWQFNPNKREFINYSIPLYSFQVYSFHVDKSDRIWVASMDTIALISINQLPIDITPPVITITGVSNGATYALGLVPIASYTVTDSLSGVATSSATLTGGDGLGLGTFTYIVTASDNAGNTITTSVSYNVIVTSDGLVALIQQMLASGQIDNAGIANSLISKVENAAMATNDNAADNIMQAFINQVSAQSGQHISPEAAAILINAANYIITH